MQLRTAVTSAGHPDQSDRHRLLVQVEAHSPVGNCFAPLASKNDGVAVCILSPCEKWGGPHVNLLRLSLIFAREAQARGGALIHGALAERNGHGVILAAPGGTGKTTASNRLPAPWRSLCDDATLVVRDPWTPGCVPPSPLHSNVRDVDGALRKLAQNWHSGTAASVSCS